VGGCYDVGVMRVSRDGIPSMWVGKSSGRDKVKHRDDKTC